MAEFDDAEIEAMNVVKLKARRARLRKAKTELKHGVAVVTPALRVQLDEINRQIRELSLIIYRITGEYE